MSDDELNLNDPAMWERGVLTADGAARLLELLPGRPDIETRLDAAVGRAGGARAVLDERRRSVEGDPSERKRLAELQQLAYGRGASPETLEDLERLRKEVSGRHAQLDAAVTALAGDTTPDVPPSLVPPSVSVVAQVAPRKSHRATLLTLAGLSAAIALAVTGFLFVQSRSVLDVFNERWNAPEAVPYQSILALRDSDAYAGGELRYVATRDGFDFFASHRDAFFSRDDITEVVCLYAVTRKRSDVVGAVCTLRENFDQDGISITPDQNLIEDAKVDGVDSPSVTWGPKDGLRDARG